MYIDISVPAGLYFLRSHEKFLVELLVQLIENQASLGGYQRGVRIGILLVPDIHNGLALLIYIVQHPHKILFIVPVIPVTLRHHRLHLFQRAFHDIVHNGDRHIFQSQLVHFINHAPADPTLLFFRESGQCPVCALRHGIDHLLYIEGLPASILLYNPDIPAWLKSFAVIHIFPDHMIKITAHHHHSLPK